jgi:hypothetical protein
MQCYGNKRDGTRCQASALAAKKYCALHDEPGKAAELGRLSGESRRRSSTDLLSILPPQNARDLHAALATIFAEVCSGQMDLKLGRSLGYIGSVLAKTIELSDHEIRLRAMERILNTIKSGEKKQ